MRASYLVLAAVLALGCSKKKSDTEEKKPKAEAKAVPTAAADDSEKKAVEKLVKTIKTEEDYEDEAETDITAENLHSEVDRIEKELAEEDPEQPKSAVGGINGVAKPSGAGGKGVEK